VLDFEVDDVRVVVVDTVRSEVEVVDVRLSAVDGVLLDCVLAEVDVLDVAEDALVEVEVVEVCESTESAEVEVLDVLGGVAVLVLDEVDLLDDGLYDVLHVLVLDKVDMLDVPPSMLWDVEVLVEVAEELVDEIGEVPVEVLVLPDADVKLLVLLDVDVVVLVVAPAKMDPRSMYGKLSPI